MNGSAVLLESAEIYFTDYRTIVTPTDHESGEPFAG